MSQNKVRSQIKFIQFLSLVILFLGLGTTSILVHQKINDSKAAIAPAPYPVCPANKPFFCGGCINACTNTGSLNCTQYIALHCTSTPRPATPRPTTSTPTPIPGGITPIGIEKCTLGQYTSRERSCKYITGSNNASIWNVFTCSGYDQYQKYYYWVKDSSKFCGPTCSYNGYSKPIDHIGTNGIPICTKL